MKRSFFVFLLTKIIWAAPLAVEEFLGQVHLKHEGIQASDSLIKSYSLRKDEPNLAFQPKFFTNVSYLDDRSPTINIPFQGNRTENVNLSLGLQQQFDFGLGAKLFTELNHRQIFGATFLTQSEFYDARLGLELSASLLRNWGGKELNLQVDAAVAQNTSKKLQEYFQRKALEIEAESTYYRLALLRETLQIQKESLERSKKISQWNERRASQNLADRSDFLQSQAGVQLRELELKSTEFDEAAASRTFNSLRGKESDEVPEDLYKISDFEIKPLQIPSREQLRTDTLALRYAKEALQKLAESNREKTRASLDLFGSLVSNGRDVGYDNSLADSVRFPKYVSTIGIKFLLPLDFDSTDAAQQSYIQELKALELRQQRKELDERVEWSTLAAQIKDNATKIELAQNILKVQEEKYKHEKQRQSLGRSTTYLVLQFEQDYENSELNLIRLKAERLLLAAKAKLFEPVSDS